MVSAMRGSSSTTRMRVGAVTGAAVAVRVRRGVVRAYARIAGEKIGFHGGPVLHVERWHEFIGLSRTLPNRSG